ASAMLVNILGITDDAKCDEVVRQLRWPQGVHCPHCEAHEVVKQGRDETERQRRRDECRSCGRRFDDLTGTIFAGHHQPLRFWVLVLYFIINKSTASGGETPTGSAVADVDLGRSSLRKAPWGRRTAHEGVAESGPREVGLQVSR